MTTQKAIDIFNIIQDKYGSPDVDEDEVIEFLNMALYEWLNRLVPSNLGGVVNYELDANTLSNIRPLVFNITALMNGSGILTDASITTALVTAGAEAGATWYRIGNVGITLTGETQPRPVRFKKHNEIFAHLRNFFKRTSATKLAFTLAKDGLTFRPINTADSLSLTVIKHPRLLSLVDNPELDDQNMYNVLLIALKMAGVATREEELITDIRNTAVQIAQ